MLRVPELECFGTVGVSLLRITSWFWFRLAGFGWVLGWLRVRSVWGRAEQGEAIGALGQRGKLGTSVLPQA